MYTIYTVDDTGRLRGVLSLRELLAAPEGTRISELAWSEVVSVSPDMLQEEVSQITSNYDLVALPVVDVNKRLLGVVTVDDVIEAFDAATVAVNIRMGALIDAAEVSRGI
jgi:magnesium transporter